LRCGQRRPADNIAFADLDEQLTYEPFDVVYTWVNGSDPRWKAKKDLWSKMYETAANASVAINSTVVGELHNRTVAINSTTTEADDTMSLNRYRDSEELRFSLRSLVKNAPWIRHIYVVTDNQIPYWLNLDTAKLTVVSHEDIFMNKSHLPVFSSPAIEANLHRIPGLSKKFIYFNDDVFLGMKVFPEDFISLRGAQRLIMSWDVPKCAPGCSDTWIGDGFCDKACNVAACNFDFPDCVNGTNSNTQGGYNANSRPSSSQAMCTKGCPDNWLGDKICDQRCKNEECGWDMGDCGLDLVTRTFPGVAIDRSNARILEAGTELVESMSYGGEDYHYGPGGGMFGEAMAEGLLPDENGPAWDNMGPGTGQNTTHTPLHVGSNSTHRNMETNATESVGEISEVAVRESLGFPAVVKQEPALTAEYGTKAVYFDLAFLACMHSSNATCVPEQVSDFLYERAEHDDEEGRVVHSANVLSKHHILVVLLYYGQEGAPDPVTQPVDVRFTLSPLNTATSASHSVVFTLRVAPPAPAGKRYPGELVPSGMALLPHAPAHTCASDEDKHARRGNASTRAVELPVSAVTVLSHPYRESHAHAVSTTREGAIAEVSLAAGSDVTTTTSGQLHVRYTVTEVSGRAWITELPLFDALILNFTSDPAPRFRPYLVHEMSLGTSLAELLRVADATVSAFEAHVANCGPPHSPRFRQRPGGEVGDMNSSSVEDAAHPAHLRILLKLPVPIAWRNMPEPAWLHVRAEIFEQSLSGADHLPIAHQWHAHNASLSTHSPVESPAACIGAVVLWGSQPTAPSNGTTLQGNGTAHINTPVVPDAEGKTHNATAHTVPVTAGDQDAAHELLSPHTDLANSTGRRLSDAAPAALSVLASVNMLLNWITQYWGLASWTRNRRTARRLEDTYGASLVHVNRLYNKEFGSEGRKVPAHVPHMIDRDYMQEMQARWSEQWNATSAHRFRSSTDMQYSFSYYYYLMNRHKVHPHDLHKYLAHVLDTDRDGYLNDNEFRSLATMVKSSASPKDTDIEHMRECVSNSSTYRRTHTEEAHHVVPRGKVRKAFTVELQPRIDEVLNCTEVVDGLRKYINWNNMFPTHVLDSDKDLVAFEMIGDNYTISLSQLDSVRARQSKFICINDNMKNPPPELERALRSFYESFFPEPCVFELPAGVRNPTLYLDEYQSRKRQRADGLSRASEAMGRLFSSLGSGCWRSTKSTILAIARATIDAVSGEDRTAQPELYVNGLREDILRGPQYDPPADSHAVGLGHVALFFSAIGVVGFVVLRRLSKRRAE
jgi:hypothetical protein